MNVGYMEPLQYAWRWAREELFHPFDLGKWVVLGFTAWLAYLFHGGGANNRGTLGFEHGTGDLRHVTRAASHAMHSLLDRFLAHPVAGTLVLFGAVVVLAILVGLLWISSRFKFVFLDNVVRNRAEIVEPWRRLGELGDSLFVWRLGFGLVSLVLAAVLAGSFMWGIVLFATGNHIITFPGLLLASAGGLLALLTTIVLVCIALWTESFVIPIMYRFRLGAWEAWGYFLPWLKTYPLQFGLYALWIVVLGAGVLVAVMVAGLATCCVGLVLVALPYVGTVVLLPVWVTYRMLGPAFLEQFDPKFSLVQPVVNAAGAEPVSEPAR